MRADAITLEGGFSEPVLASQSVFRCLMDAMARPGTKVQMNTLVSPPAPLHRVAAAIACTLIDADTPFWLDDMLGNNQRVASWLAFQTGSRLAATRSDAIFALAGDPSSMPAFDQFAQGTQEYPDRSATLILQLDALEGSPPLLFEGPGIDGRATISASGLPADFAKQWTDNAARFPRGVDLVLTANDTIICLPRSTRLVRPGA